VEKLAEEFLLIGNRMNRVEQHAMDLSTAVSALGISVRAGDFRDMAGSDIVINAAGAPQGIIKDRMEMLPKNTAIIKSIAQNIKKYCPKAVIITATNPVDPLNYAMYLAGGFNRRQVIGYTINDTFRFRESLAKAYNARVDQTDALVIGEHGSTQVLLFSTARINGEPVSVAEDIKTSMYNEIQLILKRFEELQAGRTAGWTCAVGMAAYVRAIKKNKGQILPCSAVLSGEYGQKDISMAVPAILGTRGIEEIQNLDLNEDENERLKITISALKKTKGRVEELLI
jgi:malate dehydrogenase